ncbi:MAG: RIP metalloprotease RseP [Firmicutes bacterium HGW-Firmicutes-14]|nr:MAG: RIP metalloprotease RseP [Firmicutes bacterium HGW-Firmicutes-14]
MSDWILYFPYAVIVFGMLVLFHELGHFVVAKLAGVEVYEFSIGFGPRLAGLKKNGTAYNLRIVPLGGFVRMAGMDPEEDKREASGTDSKGDDRKRDENEDARIPVVDPEKSFMNKSVPKRMAIIAAGPLMNFVLAIVLFALIISLTGTPVNRIEEVLTDKPAAAAGIKAGDVITKIDDTRITSWNDILTVIHASPGKELRLEVQRDGKTKIFNVVPEKDRETQVGLIGIKPETRSPGLLESLKFGTLKTYEMLKLTFTFLGKIISREMPVELSGPVRITYELGRAAETGLENLIFLAGFLSVQIGLFNLLPIPALDGSRLVFLGLEGVRGTPIDPSKENFIHLVGLAFLLLVMVVVTYQDIIQMLS